MQNLTKNNSQGPILGFLKLLVLVVVFYVTINYFFTGTKNKLNVDINTYQTGEKVEISYDKARKDFFDKHDIAPSEHQIETDIYDNSAETQEEFLEKFQSMCILNIEFCEKIKFQGEFSTRDKYMYLATSIYLLQHMEENLNTDILPKEQLKKITINDDKGARRGFANRDSVTINLGTVLSYSEFLELMAHEMGHVADLGIIKGKSRQKDFIFTEFDKAVFETDDPSIEYYKLSWDSETIRNSLAKKEDFCSSYGMTDPFEDFAECHNLYLNHNAVFKYWAENNELMQKKYNFMSNLYAGKYIFTSNKDLEKSKFDNTWRPWDTTKM